MNQIKPILLAIALLSITRVCDAQLYAANISATLSTQMVAGTDYFIQTVAVNNASIIKAIVTSGSYPGSKASDFAVVYADNGNEDVEVINKSNNDALVTVLATTGLTSTFNAIDSISRNKELDYCTEADYEFTFPDIQGTLVTNAILKFNFNQTADALRDFDFVFVGANGFYNSGATFFEGTIKKGTKIYQ